MTFPKVLIGMIVALIVFAVGASLLWDSVLWITVSVIIAAVVLQVGYFLVVVGMAGREAQRRRGTDRGPRRDSTKAADDETIETRTP